MPDIDIDFSVKGRERVIRYVQEKYGADASPRSSRSARWRRARDARRGPGAGLDYATGDRLAKLIPEPIMGRNPSFEDCLGGGRSCGRPTTATLRQSRSSTWRAASRASSATTRSTRPRS